MENKKTFTVEGSAAMRVCEEWLSKPVPVVVKRSWWQRFVAWLLGSKN